jgi:IMP dehydrogenase
MDQSKIIDSIGLTFDDVLLLPNFAGIKREEIDTSSYLTDKVKLRIPLISSPMDTVTTSTMAIALGRLGGMGIIHRNLTIEKQMKEVETVKKADQIVGAAVGVGSDLTERIEGLIYAGIDAVVIDSAHGFSKSVIEATRFISQKYNKIPVISGSVATGAGAKALIEAGARSLRVGMGPGSICTTRIVSGMGVPQITAILETPNFRWGDQISRRYNQSHSLRGFNSYARIPFCRMRGISGKSSFKRGESL